jgi:signal transduction histidine kinase
MSNILGFVYISIEDNGCGICEEDQENLFKPFFTSKPHGTGLGLVIVKKMLSKMGGTIDIQSRHDHGTKVTISIPEKPTAKRQI